MKTHNTENISTELESFTECNLRDVIGFDCEITITPSEESKTEVLLFEKELKVYEKSEEDLEEFIIADLGMISEEEFLKLKEDNKKLDELLNDQSSERNLNKLGINIISGTLNNE